MDRKHIDDQHVVARYLADQLSDSDREAFEAYCSANPEMFREIEAAARFKVGLAKLEEKNELKPIVEGTTKPARPSAFRLAAAMAGLVIGGVAIYGAVVSVRVPAMGATVVEVSGRLREPLPFVKTQMFALSRNTLEPERVIELPTQPAAIQLRVMPNLPFAPRYRAILSSVVDGGTRRIARVDGLELDDQNLVTVYFNSERVRPGRHEIALTPEGLSSSAAIESRFEFEIRTKSD